MDIELRNIDDIRPPWWTGCTEERFCMWDYGSNKWNCGEIVSAGASDVAKMTTFKGSADMPPWGGINYPADPGPNASVYLGHSCSGAKAVVDWASYYV